MNNITEELKNDLNYEIRSLLKIIEIVDGKTMEYSDYKENTLSEDMFLKQQIELVQNAKSRLLNVFKD